MSWPLVKIKDVGRVFTGKTPSKATDEYFGGDIPFVTPAELDGDVYVCTAKQTLNELGAKQIKLLPKDSVMVCCIGSLGKIGIAGRELATNQQVNSVVFDEAKVFSKYGFYALSLLRPILEKIAPSTTVPIVNKSNFESLEIPLPPLEEQKRIAAILDKADAIRRKRQQAIKLADDFLRSVFLEMFGDPVTNPKGWEVKELSELVADGDRINYGIVQPGNYVEDGVPIVRVGDFELGKINPSNLKKVASEIDIKHKPSRLVGDEILIACVGATAGKVALIDETLKGCNTVRAVTRIRVSSRVNRHYVFRYLQSPYVQSYIQRQLRTVGQPTLNGKQISQIPILIPDQESQDRYLSIAEKASLIVDRLNHGHERFVEQFNSVSQKAFSGEL